MSSAGHILDMINRIKQNKTLRKRKKFKENNRKNSYSEKMATATEYDFPAVSAAALERIKVRIRRNAKANHRKSIYTLVIIIILVAFVIWSFTRYYRIGPYMTY